MSRFRSRGRGRSPLTRPNTSSPNITCKVRACKVRTLLNDAGFCKTHRKREVNENKLYENCRECDELVKSGQSGITCDKCEIWFHTACVSISEEQYACMVKCKESGQSPKFLWFCRFCKDVVTEAIDKIDLLETQTRNVAISIAKLNERVENIEKKMSTSVVKNVKSQLDERMDIDRRKMNLMLYNVEKPAVTRNDGADSKWYSNKKKESDTRAFIDIMKELEIGIGTNLENKIVDIVRLGDLNKIPPGSKGRPLRVTLSDLDIKREILGKAKLLRDTRYNTVYISPDLTPAQREADHNLRMELKKRREAGETNLMIKRGNIISSNLQKPPASEPTQKRQLKKPIVQEQDIYSDVSTTKEGTDKGSESDEMPPLARRSSSSSSSDSESEQVENTDVNTGPTNPEDMSTIIEEPILIDKQTPEVDIPTEPVNTPPATTANTDKENELESGTEEKVDNLPVDLLDSQDDDNTIGNQENVAPRQTPVDTGDKSNKAEDLLTEQISEDVDKKSTNNKDTTSEQKSSDAKDKMSAKIADKHSDKPKKSAMDSSSKVETRSSSQKPNKA